MDKFTSKHFMFMIFGVAIISIKTYPTIFTRNSGKDTSVVIVLSSLLIIFCAVYIFSIAREKNMFNIYEIYRATLGNFLGTIAISLLLLTIFLTLLESSSVEANAMHTNLLIETPTWFFLLFFIVPAIYTIKRDIVAIFTVTIIGISLIMLAGINLSILTVKYKDSRNLLPFFANGLTPGFFLSTIQTLGLYGSIFYLFPFLQKVEDKSKLIKHSVIALLITTQIVIVGITGVIATFGIERLNNMAFPKLLQTQLISYFHFIESGELFVMLQMVGGWYLRYIISFYALLEILKTMKIDNHLLIYILSILAFVCSYFLAKDILLLFDFFNVYTYVAFINFIVIPLIAFTILKFKSTKQSEGN
jgi:spore germination protein (amino acid permease)